MLLSYFLTFPLLSSLLVGRAEGIRARPTHSSQESHQWTRAATERVRQSKRVLYLYFLYLSSIHLQCGENIWSLILICLLKSHLLCVSAVEWLLCRLASALGSTRNSFARSPAIGGRATGQSGLAQDPENGWRTECKDQRKGEEERTPQDHVLAYPGRHHLLQVLPLLMVLLWLAYCTPS